MCENYFNIDKSALHFFSEIQKQKTERPEKRTPAKGNSFFVCLPTRICVIYGVCVNYMSPLLYHRSVQRSAGTGCK